MSQMRMGVIACLAFCTMAVEAQTYTYQWEGFEELAWATSSADVTVATGKWTTNKNRQNTEQVYEGTFSLLISSKAGLVTP